MTELNWKYIYVYEHFIYNDRVYNNHFQYRMATARWYYCMTVQFRSLLELYFMAVVTKTNRLTWCAVVLPTTSAVSRSPGIKAQQSSEYRYACREIFSWRRKNETKHARDSVNVGSWYIMRPCLKSYRAKGVLILINEEPRSTVRAHQVK